MYDMMFSTKENPSAEDRLDYITQRMPDTPDPKSRFKTTWLFKKP